MEHELINWWKKLSHNEKKIFLVNYDFENSKTEIKTYSDLYSQYKIIFGIGIRQRLDNFHVTDDNIRKILRLRRLIINHVSFNNLSILQKFENLDELYYHNDKIQDIIFLHNKNLNSLSIQCYNLNNLDFLRLSKIENLNLIYCYKLSNLDALKECTNLKKLNISHFGIKLKANNLSHIDEISLNMNLIYPNNFKKYNEKFDKMNKFLDKHIFNRKHLYIFDNEETKFILQNGNEFQKINYYELILSKIYSVYVNDFMSWTLKKNYS